MTDTPVWHSFITSVYQRRLSLSGCVVQCDDLTVQRTATELTKHSFHIATLAISNTHSDHLFSPFISKRQFWCGLKRTSLASLCNGLRVKLINWTVLGKYQTLTHYINGRSGITTRCQKTSKNGSFYHSICHTI